VVEIPAVVERCAGIDVGKSELAATLVVGSADKDDEVTTQNILEGSVDIVLVFRRKHKPETRRQDRVPGRDESGSPASAWASDSRFPARSKHRRPHLNGLL
jgi:hypothetical protein